MGNAAVWLICLGVLAFAQPARAFAEPEALSPALGCLAPAADRLKKLEYPEAAFERRDGGTVEVELRFAAADQPPGVKLIDGSFLLGGGPLVEAVIEHVAQFRVPCMGSADAPVTLRQQYVFTPNDGRKVAASLSVDAAGEVQRTLRQCIVHADGELKPSYPNRARRKGDEGKVLAMLLFTRADAPPEVTLIDGTLSTALRGAVQHHAQGFRMPCLQDRPVQVARLFSFLLEDGLARRAVLQDMTLLGLVRNAGRFPQPVFFDLTAMGCPFDVRLTYYRPHFYNRVEELETSVAARRPFLDWLSQIELKLSPTLQTAMYGETSSITVPCGSVDL